MFFRKKAKMDELKKTDQEQVEEQVGEQVGEQVEELTDDQLEDVAGGVVDDAYGQFEPMPEMRE